MTVATIQRSGASAARVVTPQALLVSAGVVIAVAIAVGPPLARALNGAGGLIWIAGAVWMLAQLRGEPRRWTIAGVALAGAAMMAIIVRPGTYLESVTGFMVAGAAVVLASRHADGRWAMLAPALYFPLHIVVAGIRVVASGGARAVRTDPPPTDALVPLSMIVAAAVGGALVARWWGSRQASPRG